LKLVGAQLLHQANAAALLMLIEDYPSPLIRDHPHREMKLIATVASQRVEDIPSRALRMNANDRR
jgi:hypothetical protein